MSGLLEEVTVDIEMSTDEIRQAVLMIRAIADDIENAAKKIRLMCQAIDVATQEVEDEQPN